MQPELLAKRLRVVVVTTRAAAHSFVVGDAQSDAAVRRGLALLDGIGREVDGDPTIGGLERVDEARREVQELLVGVD